jgi:polyhydroxyalkanoate synthesis regulator phasin
MVRREEIRAMQDAWRAYLDLALGLTETSRKKATKVARKLVGRGNATADQLQSMAEDLVSTSLANREALTRLIRFELERALGRVGLATAEEVTALNARVRELEQQLDEARNGGVTPAAPLETAVAPAPAPPVPAKTVAKKTVAKKAAAPVTPPAAPVVADVEPPVPAPASPARKAPAKKVATATPAAKRQVPVKRTSVKKTAATKPAATKTAAKKTAATKTAAKKTAAKKTATKAAAGEQT